MDQIAKTRLISNDQPKKLEQQNMPSVSCWVAVYRDERAHTKSAGFFRKPKKSQLNPSLAGRVLPRMFNREQQLARGSGVGMSTAEQR